MNFGVSELLGSTRSRCLNGEAISKAAELKRFFPLVICAKGWKKPEPFPLSPPPPPFLFLLFNSAPVTANNAAWPPQNRPDTFETSRGLPSQEGPLSNRLSPLPLSLPLVVLLPQTSVLSNDKKFGEYSFSPIAASAGFKSNLYARPFVLELRSQSSFISLMNHLGRWGQLLCETKNAMLLLIISTVCRITPHAPRFPLAMDPPHSDSIIQRGEKELRALTMQQIVGTLSLLLSLFVATALRPSLEQSFWGFKI